MILLDRVTKTYGKVATPALDRISLHVEPKEFVIVVGESGAGKTTLLRLLTREEKPTSGKIIVGGIDYDKLKDREIPLLRRKIGVVFQDFKLLPTRTVAENVAFALIVTGHEGSVIREETERVLSLVGLTPRRDHFPDQLSGGEQQRTAIARALANSPKLLLADEPTGNLDPETSAHVFHELLELIRHTGVAALMATHNLALAARMHRVLRLERGLLIETNPATVG